MAGDHPRVDHAIEAAIDDILADSDFIGVVRIHEPGCSGAPGNCRTRLLHIPPSEVGDMMAWIEGLPRRISRYREG